MQIIIMDDLVAPVLSSATDTKTGSTTANISVDTDKDNGTLYWVVTQSATQPSVAQIQAGNDHAGSAADDSGNASVSTTGTQNKTSTGLSGDTTYYAHFNHQDVSGNDSNVASGDGFTTDSEGDTTAPVLSSPTDVANGSTAGDIGVTTDEDNGTLYWVVTQSATSPSKAQVKAGQDDGGSAADDSGNAAVVSTGVKAFSTTGLTYNTTYYAHFMHEDAATNQSDVSSADGFTTDNVSQPDNKTFTTSTTYTVPAGADAYDVAITVNGSGGGGGGGGGGEGYESGQGYDDGSDGTDGGDGGDVRFNLSEDTGASLSDMVGAGGDGGQSGEGGGASSSGHGGDGSAGTGSGGTTNDSLGASGGSGGAGGDGSFGAADDGGDGGDGGRGGRAIRTVSAGTLTPGATITVTVGSGGSGGNGGSHGDDDFDATDGDDGDAGTKGTVVLTWSAP